MSSARTTGDNQGAAAAPTVPPRMNIGMDPPAGKRPRADSASSNGEPKRPAKKARTEKRPRVRGPRASENFQTVEERAHAAWAQWFDDSIQSEEADKLRDAFIAEVAARLCAERTPQEALVVIQAARPRSFRNVPTVPALSRAEGEAVAALSELLRGRRLSNGVEIIAHARIGNVTEPSDIPDDARWRIVGHRAGITITLFIIHALEELALSDVERAEKRRARTRKLTNIYMERAERRLRAARGAAGAAGAAVEVDETASDASDAGGADGAASSAAESAAGSAVSDAVQASHLPLLLAYGKLSERYAVLQQRLVGLQMGRRSPIAVALGLINDYNATGRAVHSPVAAGLLRYLMGGKYSVCSMHRARALRVIGAYNDMQRRGDGMRAYMLGAIRLAVELIEIDAVGNIRGFMWRDLARRGFFASVPPPSLKLDYAPVIAPLGPASDGATYAAVELALDRGISLDAASAELAEPLRWAAGAARATIEILVDEHNRGDGSPSADRVAAVRLVERAYNDRFEQSFAMRLEQPEIGIVNVSPLIRQLLRIYDTQLELVERQYIACSIAIAVFDATADDEGAPVMLPPLAEVATSDQVAVARRLRAQHVDAYIWYTPRAADNTLVGVQQRAQSAIADLSAAASRGSSVDPNKGDGDSAGAGSAASTESAE